MAHLIDKDALLAEIERRRDNYINSFMTEQVHVLNEVLDFLATLEVKEVDLEKELSKVWKDWANEYAISFVSYKEIAKHFFELGMSVSNKAKKGEEV